MTSSARPDPSHLGKGTHSFRTEVKPEEKVPRVDA
jgi:hypothetical protein